MPATRRPGPPSVIITASSANIPASASTFPAEAAWANALRSWRCESADAAKKRFSDATFRRARSRSFRHAGSLFWMSAAISVNSNSKSSRSSSTARFVEPNAQATFAWAAFTGVARFSDGILLMRGRIIRWLPDSALQNSVPEEALAFVRSKIEVVEIG
jgi:hypothetical protein